MAPPRSDNWSGCVGLFVAIVFYLIRQKNLAALNVTLYGFMAGGICSMIVLGLSGKPVIQPEAQITTSDQFWKPNMRHWISWMLIPVLIILLAYLSVLSHDEPMPGSHLRFTKNLTTITDAPTYQR